MKRNEIIRMVGVCKNGVLADMEMSEDYSKIRARVCDGYDAFKEAIRKYPEIEKLYDNFDNARIDMHIEECDLYYSEAFRLGVLLGMDIAKTDK